jgi:hypothetical protein
MLIVTGLYLLLVYLPNAAQKKESKPIEQNHEESQQR